MLMELKLYGLKIKCNHNLRRLFLCLVYTWTPKIINKGFSEKFYTESVTGVSLSVFWSGLSAVLIPLMSVGGTVDVCVYLLYQRVLEFLSLDLPVSHCPT